MTCATDGFLNLNKPRGLTSNAAVERVRRALREVSPPGAPGLPKAGHLGTLDPMAEGVLPIAVGGATRLWRYAALEPKIYRFELTFGIETDSLDAEGRVVARRVVKGGELEGGAIEQTLSRFRGSLLQTPPAFSAVKQGGRPLYERARRGEAASPLPREVHIHDLRLISLEAETPPRGSFEVTCSGGTYVRSLGSDLGRALGCGAHVSALLRLRAGVFSIEESTPLEAIEASPWKYMLPAEFPVTHLPCVRLSPEEAERIARGASLPAPAAPAGWIRLQVEGRLVGMGCVAGGRLVPKTVLTLSG
jgi:tRNA pseudouridine55 synthase